MADTLFVYGSLMRKPDGGLHPLLLDQAEYLGAATLPGKLYLVQNYPGAVYGEQAHLLIRGDVYRLHNSAKLLTSLDEYEECTADAPTPHEYLRCWLPILMADGRTLSAWVYLYNLATNELEQISDGDYRRYLNNPA